MTHYRRSDRVVATPLNSAETVLLHLGKKRYFSLNETGTLIWNLLPQHAAPDGLADALALQYEITPAAARTEVELFLEELRERGIIVTSEA